MQDKLLQGVVLDLEVNPKDNTIFKIGALYPYKNIAKEYAVNGKKALEQALREIDDLACDALFVIGHNILEHDLPLLKKQAPYLSLLQLPVIDTLRLSPLAFPQNPYHSLIKNYKIITDSLNSPLADCEATLKLYKEQYAALLALQVTYPLALHCFQTLLADENMPEFYFSSLSSEVRLEKVALQAAILSILKEEADKVDFFKRDLKVCKTRLLKLLKKDIFQKNQAWPIVYALSWLRVSGGNSVLAPWVKHQFPKVNQLIAELRDEPCDKVVCQYCQSTHNPRSELKRYFNFDDFRYETDGESIQYDVTLAGMRGKNVLAILPTGGGKSICYQLPALNRYHRNGSLSIIISPLQSLMKDQVDGLMQRGITSVAMLNGMLSLPERSDVLSKIQLGDVGLLLVSPEQFRNLSFQNAIAQRTIGAWIYDEAHCLSKWGNDFRSDYLYVARFIKKFTGNHSIAPISCFTATAKPDVIEDIRRHFSSILGVTFYERVSFQARENLSFDAFLCQGGEKLQLMDSLLKEELADRKSGAVVFVASRRKAESHAENLCKLGWNCQHFHAGLLPNEKQDIQDAFIKGDIQIIVSTNAFGMGVDKPDVRLVIHADIPGSLENYIQEAGRAGRDRENARCVLLYDAQDIETQFGLTERSKLSQRDINAIYRKLRQESVKRQHQDVVITSGEILNDITAQTNIDVDDNDAKTKVTTAIAWLERGEYLERTDNKTRVFPAHCELSLEAAQEKLNQAQLSERKREEYGALVSFLYAAKDDEFINTDELMTLTACSSDELLASLRQLEQLKILSNDTEITAFLRSGMADSSAKRLEKSLARETTLLSVLSELEPDVDHEHWFNVNLADVKNHMQEQLQDENLLPLHIKQLLYSISQEMDGDSRRSSSMRVRDINRELLQIQFTKPSVSWATIRHISERRIEVARVLLQTLLALLPSGQKGKDLLVKTTFSQLQIAVFDDLSLNIDVVSTKQQTAIELVLLYLHQQEVIVLNNGLTVMRNAMTIHVNADKQKNRYTKADFDLLNEHYKERRVQIHVMREYAEKAVRSMSEALKMVFDYFTMDLKTFRKCYFSGREALLDLATSEVSWKKIVNELNPQQKEIVEEKNDENRLILAGPGSGKTRVVVHRIAYLLRVQRVAASSIIALTFNRHAAIEIRKRLFDLVGNEAFGLTVLTYHSMAMRLTGTRFNRGQNISTTNMETVMQQAVQLLEGQSSVEGEDELRDALLKGYRYIIVDEYQDIDDWQYRLVSALSGQKLTEVDGKLCILAVGDDDQNIYAFRHSSNAYIEKFCQDYQAQTTYLVQNYRSTQHIIQASNEVIGLIDNRLKKNYKIIINHERKTADPGGQWSVKDPLYQGKIKHLCLPQKDEKKGYQQAQAAMQSLAYIESLDENFTWANCAVLARSHEFLYPIQAYCESRGIPYFMAADKKSGVPLTRQREFLDMIVKIQSIDSTARLLELWWRDLEYRHLNTWWKQFFSDLQQDMYTEYGQIPLSAAEIIHYWYEYAHDFRQKTQQGLFVGTVYAAKGLEFQHVVLLDGAWGMSGKSTFVDECRVYYVGMTRAKETLAVCQFGDSHPFCHAINQAVHLPLSFQWDPALAVRYDELSLKDVHLGCFSEQKYEKEQAYIATMKVGDALEVMNSRGGYDICCAKTRKKVGRLAKSYILNMEVIACEVAAIVTRFADEDSRGRKDLLPTWEVIVPRIKGRPLSSNS